MQSNFFVFIDYHYIWFFLKILIKKHLRKNDINFEDENPDNSKCFDYSIVAFKIVNLMANYKLSLEGTTKFFGILICGLGIGV
jgi:ribose 5-phosphate isomerase RpiB